MVKTCLKMYDVITPYCCNFKKCNFDVITYLGSEKITRILSIYDRKLKQQFGRNRQ